MKDKIKTLLELQKLDTQIADIQKTIKEVPDTIISLTNKIEFDERKINNLNEKIAGSNKEIKVLQNETLDIDQKISQLEDKLFLIKSSKEFEALQKETGDLKRKKIDVEDNQLKIMEEIQSLTKNSELLQSKFDEELSPVKEEIKKLEAELKESRSEIEVIENDRPEIMKNIDNEVLKVYTKLLSNSSPVAVEAKGEVCGYCYMKIPPQTYIKVLQSNEIILCPCSKKILIPEIS
ncbi:MAG TPA: hypothetical protein EYO89_03040 [Candidatus Dadabacteria bacterium]|nr:hypothetical protein [Candidatus Dadabacteria bacterium]